MRNFLPMLQQWSNWSVWATWLLCLAVITALGMVRVVTDAEYAFASLGLLPALFVTWVGGRKSGLALAVFASVMWLAADILSERQFSFLWIPWVNAFTRLLTYTLLVLLLDQIRIQLLEEHLTAIKDGLTGLGNKNQFLLDGESEVERSKRYDHHMAIVFLDLDFLRYLTIPKVMIKGIKR